MRISGWCDSMELPRTNLFHAATQDTPNIVTSATGGNGMVWYGMVWHSKLCANGTTEVEPNPPMYKSYILVNIHPTYVNGM